MTLFVIATVALLGLDALAKLSQLWVGIQPRTTGMLIADLIVGLAWMFWGVWLLASGH